MQVNRIHCRIKDEDDERVTSAMKMLDASDKTYLESCCCHLLMMARLYHDQTLVTSARSSMCFARFHGVAVITFR